MQSDARSPMPPLRRVAIIGVGLLGGSIAKTLKRLDPAVQCLGFARNAETAERLRRYRWLDDVSPNLEAVCEGADVVVVATPVHLIADLARRCVAATPEGALITDVGSTKSSIVEQTSDLPTFVASHPIAGSEQSGAEAAVDDLFESKLTILTPGFMTTKSMVDRAHQFWQSLGCRTIEMSPAKHDEQLAAVSHVPHMAAALVARLTPPQSGELVGSGWRDLTRVAAGDVAMWTAIVESNRIEIAKQLERLRSDLDHLIKNLDDPVAVREFLHSAKTIKDEIDP